MPEFLKYNGWEGGVDQQLCVIEAGHDKQLYMNETGCQR